MVNSSAVRVAVREPPSLDTLLPASIVAITGAQPSWLRFGGGPSSSPTNAKPSVRPWGMAMKRVSLNLAGQCFDSNTAPGDGCFNGSVETYCKCNTTGAVFRRSSCQCANSTTFLTLEHDTIFSTNFTSFDNETILSGPAGDLSVRLPSALGRYFIISCFHDSLCNDTRIQRLLHPIINGTWQIASEANLTRCPLDLCAYEPPQFLIDLAPYGAPFAVGTRIQFAWWSNPNTTKGAPPGLLARSGPFASSSPNFLVTRLVPRVYNTSDVFFLTDVTRNISFTSNIRRPSAITIWMYEGRVGGSPAPSNYSGTDPAMTSIVSRCTSSYPPARILHSCSVDIPAARFPLNQLYLVARVDFEGVDGTIGEIGVSIGGVFFSPLATPTPSDTSRRALLLPGYAIEPGAALNLLADGNPVDATEVVSRRNRTYAEFFLNRDSQGAYRFVSTGQLTIQISDGFRTISLPLGRIFQCASQISASRLLANSFSVQLLSLSSIPQMWSIFLRIAPC